MPPEPFMKMAAKEVLALRARVESLEAENNILRSQRLSLEEGKALKSRIAGLEGENKALKSGTLIERYRERNRQLKKHTLEVAKRYVDALNGDVPPNLKYLLELAYFTGRADEIPDFEGFYEEVSE